MLSEDVMSSYDSDLIVSPSVFFAFGSPMQAIDFDEYNESITDFLGTIPYPRSILIVSPFWRTKHIEITGAPYPDLIYDFEGGPDTLRVLTYPCAGNVELANSIKNLLADNKIKSEINQERGLDKGAWVPLYVAYPDMDVPIVQMSLPKKSSPKELFKIGKSLADLRRMGVMIIVVGNTVFDENKYDMDAKIQDTDDWAEQLDNWIKEKSFLDDFDLLFDIKKHAPHGDKIDMNRLDPLYFLFGTKLKKDVISTIFDQFYYGNTSMRSFAYLNDRK
ncbi:MAG: dioxygenase [Candidatus Heimdallarchaeota archaeon]|nr:dioxygenase [Candidatus Heimdallarchaeota archaeon]